MFNQRILNKARPITPLLQVLLILLTLPSDAHSRHRPKPIDRGDLYMVIKNGRFGYIDGQGNVVIPPRYVLASPFSEGLAHVMIRRKRGWEFKEFTSYIDKSGRTVIRPLEGSGSDFSSGIAKILIGASYSYIDKRGRWASLASCQDAEDCTEGLCAIEFTGRNPRWGYINTHGKIVVKAQYDWAKPFKEGVARVGIMIGEPYTKNGAPAHDGKEGYIDKTGRAVTELKFEKAWDFSDGMAQVRLSGKWGYIDKTGTLVISPQYDETQAFQEGLAGVKINGLWGFVDKTGRLAITPQFEYVNGFSEGLAVIGKAGKSFYIDSTGRSVLSPPYKSLGSFRNGLARYTVDDKSGVIDKSGKVIIPAQFNSIETLPGGVIMISDPNLGIGYADRTGKFFWNPSY